MLTFCVLVSQTGGPLPEHVLERLRDPECPEVPFEARHHLVWSNASRTVWFAGWQDGADGASASHHWHVDDDALTAFSGQVWPRLDGWRRADPWAEQLAELLRSTPLRAGADDLAGVFVALSLRRRGPSSVAADPLGIGLTYWGHGREFVAISSRASLAAAVLAAESSAAPIRGRGGKRLARLLRVCQRAPDGVRAGHRGPRGRLHPHRARRRCPDRGGRRCTLATRPRVHGVGRGDARRVPPRDGHRDPDGPLPSRAERVRRADRRQGLQAGARVAPRGGSGRRDRVPDLRPARSSRRARGPRDRSPVPPPSRGGFGDGLRSGGPAPGAPRAWRRASRRRSA